MRKEALIEALEKLGERVRTQREVFGFSDVATPSNPKEMFKQAETATEQIMLFQKHLRQLLAYHGQGLIDLIANEYSDQLLRANEIIINPKENRLDLSRYANPLLLLSQPAEPLMVVASDAQPVEVFATPDRTVHLNAGRFNLWGKTTATVHGASYVDANDFSRVTVKDGITLFCNDYSRGQILCQKCKVDLRGHSVFPSRMYPNLDDDAVTPIGISEALHLSRTAEASQCAILSFELSPFGQEPYYSLTPPSAYEWQQLQKRYIQITPSDLYLPQHYHYNPNSENFTQLKQAVIPILQDRLSERTRFVTIQREMFRMFLLDELLCSSQIQDLLTETQLAGLLRQHYSQQELEDRHLYLFDRPETILHSMDRAIVVGANNRAYQQPGTQASYIERAQGFLHYAKAEFYQQAAGFLTAAEGQAYQDSLLLIKDGTAQAYGRSTLSAYGNSRCFPCQQSLCLSHDQTYVLNSDQATTIQYGQSKVFANSGTVFGACSSKFTDQVCNITTPAAVQAARERGEVRMTVSMTERSHSQEQNTNKR